MTVTCVVITIGMRAEDARVLAGLRSGDGPLSVRARPSSLKRDCDRTHEDPSCQEGVLS
jgi:hypothetical protein